MKRRLTGLLLAAAMILTLFPAQAFAADATANPFRDVRKSDWCYTAVQYVRINGFFNGTTPTTFKPNGTMSRAMFVTVLGRVVGVDAGQYQGKPSFSDVPEDAYFAPYVAWASRHGVTAGTGEGKFSPHAYINRQQMAAFFVRYFDAFGVDYETGADVAGAPADIDSVSPYARDAVLKLWRRGLLNGDGVSFNPTGNATRAQTAMVCYRMDRAVETWYKEPGVASDRVKLDPATGKPYGERPSGSSSDDGDGPDGPEAPGDLCSVRFYDGFRLIETFNVKKGTPLGRVPSVGKSSRAGAVLAGYYTDAACTTPFYADEPVAHGMNVYAKYETLEDPAEALTPASFARMDQSPDLTFQIRRISGGVEARDAAVLSVKDGTAPVALAVTPVNLPAPETPADPSDPDAPARPPAPEALVCTVAADPGFNEGCSYELTLADGWVFVDEKTGEDRPETVRTASFSIRMNEVHRLRMNEAIKYLQDGGSENLTFQINGEQYDILNTESVNAMGADGSGTFTCAGAADLLSGDILCVYTGLRPDERRSGSEARDPAAYVKVQGVSGNTVTFTPLEAEDQQRLYEIPDNFPFRVSALPGAGGTVSLGDLDTELYAIAMNMANEVGEEAAVLAQARAKLNVGDFVTFHLEEIAGDGSLFFGEVTGVQGDTITYTPTTREKLLHSMDLYDQVETTGDDLLTEENRAELETELEALAVQSGFAEEAAYLLADLVTHTNGFRENLTVQEALLLHSSARSGDQGSSFSLVNRPKIRVQLRSRGAHFGGVQATVTVSARFRVPLGSDVEAFLGDYLAIDLEGSFTEEFSFVPTVKGNIVYYEFLGIPFPNGVHVSANLDVKNYTAFSFNANIFTTDLGGIVEEELGQVSSELEAMMKPASEAAYQQSLEELLERYEELVGRDPGWITLVEEKMFSAESCFYGICYGTEGTFVIRADVNLAIGSGMEYEVGKRFNFWFEVGLFKPTAGSSTMDLLDERFAFQFYVMGRITTRMGVRLKVYVGIGTGDFASVGLTTELGPYLKLYGFFLYTYNRYRPQNSSLASVKEQKGGAIGLELGLYFTLGVEAKALGIFTYSDDFIDREFPLYHAGDQLVYYGCAYHPEPDEAVYVASESGDPADVVMTIPEALLEMDYMVLANGNRGSEARPLDKYLFSVSNPNFSLERTGDGKLKVHVKVPENVHLLRCTLTVTYRGKLPLSNYDMTTTIPLVWTDLSERQMKEYFTASVRVGNNTDGYDTVWRQKVLRGEAFSLPVGDELKTLAHWSDLRYEAGAGYGGQKTENLGITEHTVYDYNVKVKSYRVTVTGVEGGGAASRTYTAKYGEAFNFSDLAGTGERGPNNYTKFAGFEADLHADVGMDGETGAAITEAVDITRPINQRMAQLLGGGNVRVRAKYVDDSVAAVYSFTGVDHDDVTVTTGRGMEPGMRPVYAALEEVGEALGLENLDIVGITPEHGPITAAQHYTVQCLALSGERADVRFDSNGGGPVEPVGKLVGSILTNLPQPVRTGYTFEGWADESGKIVTSVVVSSAGQTLTARWTPNRYTLTFNGNGGYADGSGSNVNREVVFDSTYGELPVPRREGYRFFGWWTEPDFANGVHGGVQVSAATSVDHAEDKTVYAHWKPLLKLGYAGDLFAVSGTRNEIYDRKSTYTLGDLAHLYSQIPDRYDEEGNPIPTDGFFFELKPEVSTGVSDGTAHDAGGYKLEITRNADGLYESYTEEHHNILVIEKANWVEKIWNTGTFTAQIEGYNSPTIFTNNWVTVHTPTGISDLPDSVTNGLQFLLHRHKKGSYDEQWETHPFNEHFVDKNSNGPQCEVYLVFPDGAASKNYDLPQRVLMWQGSISKLYDKTTNPILPEPPLAS